VNRRDFVFAGIAYPLVTPGRPLVFPRDHGAHPNYRQEWWYVTGWLKTARGRDLGFQVTFFRTRIDIETSNPSKFTPRQVILAHAALADPQHGRLRHDERAGRVALGLAGSKEGGSTDVWVDGWSLFLAEGVYRTKIQARDFSFELQFEPKLKPLLQGENGFSRKGRRKEEASYYYSRPQLRVSGTANGEAVTGTGWLDHEWSSQYMAGDAAGWDWCGLNMDDGSALMAFRMRGRKGETVYAPPNTSFEVLKTWRSPRTGTVYPVSVRVNQDLVLEPLMEDQEMDARASTGTIYWEGAVRALRGNAPVGKGYLELTGYWKPMKL
jgi:predicted secreted hydrolase